MPFPDSSRTEMFELEPLSEYQADQLIVALRPEVLSDEQRAVRQYAVIAFSRCLSSGSWPELQGEEP